jgi:hypothetical protein
MVRKLAATIVLGLLAASCHTITEELPTGHTEGAPVPAPIPVVVVPVPVVTPQPTPPPAATPTPAPAPGAPAPTPRPPSAGSCNLGNGNGSGNGCPFEHARFQEVVAGPRDNHNTKKNSHFVKTK